ncbi:MAG: hypothetical protein WC058_11120 [Phycisphaeraceae bacterium]
MKHPVRNTLLIIAALLPTGLVWVGIGVFTAPRNFGIEDTLAHNSHLLVRAIERYTQEHQHFPAALADPPPKKDDVRFDQLDYVTRVE